MSGTAIVDIGSSSPSVLSDTSLSSSLQASLAHGIVFEKLQWEDAMDTLYDFYVGRKDWPHAAKVVEALSLEHPTDPAFYEKAANIYGELKDNVNAVFYFRRSFTLYILNGIAMKYVAMGNRNAARYVDSVLKIDPGNKVALSLKTH